MGSKGPGRVIWVLKVVGGSEGFRRSWKGDMGSEGPGRGLYGLYRSWKGHTD